MLVEELERPGRGLLAGSLVEIGRPLAVAETVAGRIDVDAHAWVALLQRLDLLEGNALVIVAVMHLQRDRRRHVDIVGYAAAVVPRCGAEPEALARCPPGHAAAEAIARDPHLAALA